MLTFCSNLLDYSRGLYIPRSTLTTDPYKINKNNRMHNSNLDKPFISRSCNLLRINNLYLEVFVAPSPISRNTSPDNQIVIVVCSDSLCHPETILIVDNLKKTVPILDYGM